MNLRYTWLTTKGAFVLALIQQNILSNPHWLKLIQSHVETSRGGGKQNKTKSRTNSPPTQTNTGHQ